MLTKPTNKISEKASGEAIDSEVHNVTNYEMASPCVRNCCLNQVDYCLGCKRHLDEIVSWRSYSNAQRQAIMTQLAARDISDSHSADPA